MIDQYIRDYGKRLYGLCTFLCASSYEADDLYHETWLKVVKNISKYDPAKEFEPWLTTICINTYRNTLRKLTRSPLFNAFATTEEKEEAINSVPAPENKDYSDLYAAIDKLPEKLRLTVLLFYLISLVMITSWTWLSRRPEAEISTILAFWYSSSRVEEPR